MMIKQVPLNSLALDPANVRRHSVRNLDSIAASLRRFGQQKPIVVDAKGIVRAGNGTLEAARTLGWDSVAVVETPLAGSEATAYAIADNRTSELAEWDDEALAETLKALKTEDFDLGELGFDASELAGDVIDNLESEWQGMPEMDNPSPASHELHVYFRSDEALQDFGATLGIELNKSHKSLWWPAKPPTQFVGTTWDTDDAAQ